MKYKVAELEGAQLDTAVAKAIGLIAEDGFYWSDIEYPLVGVRRVKRVAIGRWRPSQEWDYGGPIIEREHLTVGFLEDEGHWFSCRYENSNYLQPLAWSEGPTALIAAMRAYVASKFGEEVELP